MMKHAFTLIELLVVKTTYHLNLKNRALNSQKAESDNIRSFQLAVQKLNGDINALASLLETTIEEVSSLLIANLQRL